MVLYDPAAERTLCAARARPGVIAWPGRPWRCGAWAFRRRRCKLGRRPWPWRRSWPIPSLAMAQYWVTLVYYRRREAPVVQALSSTLLTLAYRAGVPAL